MKGSWGLYGHRPRPDSKEWVTNRMGGAPGPCQRQRPNVSPGGGWKQAEHVEKSGKEADVLVSAQSPSRGCLDQVLSPRGATWLCHTRAASRHMQRGRAGGRGCGRLAGHCAWLRGSLSPMLTGKEDGDVLRVSCHLPQWGRVWPGCPSPFPWLPAG